MYTKRIEHLGFAMGYREVHREAVPRVQIGEQNFTNMRWAATDKS